MEREYIKYYLSQTGRNINEIGPLLQYYPRIQKGRGVGNLFGSLFRFLKPALSSGLDLIKNEAIKTGTNILSDIVSGSNPKEVIRDQAMSGIKNLRKSAVNQLHSLYGGNITRKRKKSKVIISKKPRKSIKRSVKNNKSQLLNKRAKLQKLPKTKYRTLDIFT